MIAIQRPGKRAINITDCQKYADGCVSLSFRQFLNALMGKVITWDKKISNSALLYGEETSVKNDFHTEP